MRVYILDKHGKCREQILNWLSEDKRFTEVKVFEDYIPLIKEICKHPPDFCFVRLGLEGIPGLKTAEMIKQIYSDIRIIFVSREGNYAVDAYEIGAYGYLLCPIARDKLEKLIM